MIEDITNFRSCLHPLALLYVALLVTVGDYKEWSKGQDWYRLDYFKTNMEHIFLNYESFYTKEEKDLTSPNVYDVISNFAISAKTLKERLDLFLDFTAKAADIKLVESLSKSVSQLVTTYEVCPKSPFILAN